MNEESQENLISSIPARLSIIKELQSIVAVIACAVTESTVIDKVSALLNDVAMTYLEQTHATFSVPVEAAPNKVQPYISILPAEILL